MFITTAFGTVVTAAHSVIEGVAALLAPIAGGLAPALAIILFTVLVRLGLAPLTWLQVRRERRLATLRPRLEELRRRHRDDPAKLMAETLELQRANGAGSLAALLPALAQAPFFMVMYRVALNPPTGSLGGVALTAHLPAGWPVFAVLLLLAGALAHWSARRAAVVPEQLALLRYMPYLTVPAVAMMPLAGGIYLLTSTAWTALERVVWRPR